VSHELRTPLNSIIRFTVTDTGRGLRPEDMRHLFKPFRQINTGQSRPLS
jgi:signal transduction histidine kinase